MIVSIFKEFFQFLYFIICFQKEKRYTTSQDAKSKFYLSQSHISWECFSENPRQSGTKDDRDVAIWCLTKNTFVPRLVTSLSTFFTASNNTAALSMQQIISLITACQEVQQRTHQFLPNLAEAIKKKATKLLHHWNRKRVCWLAVYPQNQICFVLHSTSKYCQTKKSYA